MEDYIFDSDISSYLRGRIDTTHFGERFSPEEYERRASILQSVILKAPKFDGPLVLYRIVDSFYDDLQPGDHMVDPRFISTSYDFRSSMSYAEEDTTGNNMLLISICPRKNGSQWILSTYHLIS